MGLILIISNAAANDNITVSTMKTTAIRIDENTDAAYIAQAIRELRNIEPIEIVDSAKRDLLMKCLGIPPLKESSNKSMAIYPEDKWEEVLWGITDQYGRPLLTSSGGSAFFTQCKLDGEIGYETTIIVNAGNIQNKTIYKALIVSPYQSNYEAYEKATLVL